MMNEMLDRIRSESLNKKVYIKGFGNTQKRLLMYLIDEGISTDAFIVGVDQERPEGFKYLNKPFIAWDSIENEKCIVLSTNEEKKQDEDFYYKKIYKHYKVIIPHEVTINLAAFRNEDGTENFFFRPQALNYIIKKAVMEQKRFVLLGSNRDALRILYRKFSLLGVPVAYCVLINNERIETDEFRNVYDLVYEESENLFVWVLYGDENDARGYMEELGIDEMAFCTSSMHRLGRRLGFDPNLGFNNMWRGEESIITLKTNIVGDGVRVAVLGGSTTEIPLYTELSWPECLVEIAKKNGEDITLLGGAVAGYIASQELVKLERDVIPLQPDVVISYSRINEIAAKEYYFTNYYQRTIFERMANAYDGRYKDTGFSRYMEGFLINGKGFKSRAEHWLQQEIMMKAICDAYNIKFYAIIQPYLAEKANKSVYDLEVMECINWDEKNMREELYEIKEYALRNGKYDWLIDFTDIFDTCMDDIYFDIAHLMRKGNQIVAEKVYGLLF